MNVGSVGEAAGIQVHSLRWPRTVFQEHHTRLFLLHHKHAGGVSCAYGGRCMPVVAGFMPGWPRYLLPDVPKRGNVLVPRSTTTTWLNCVLSDKSLTKRRGTYHSPRWRPVTRDRNCPSRPGRHQRPVASIAFGHQRIRKENTAAPTDNAPLPAYRQCAGTHSACISHSGAGSSRSCNSGISPSGWHRTEDSR